MANFWPKPWVNPFRKISISQYLKISIEYRKTYLIFLAYITLKKRKNGQLLTKPGVNPLEKPQFFDFLNFFFIA